MMATMNAMYVNGGMINSVDLDFLASKQVFYLLWQVSLLKSDNQIHYRYTQQEIAAKIDWIHSYDKRFKVLSWLGVHPPDNPDLSTPQLRADVLARELQHVQNCHFDGLNSDLEGSGFEKLPLSERNTARINWYNEEAVAMHNIGKLSFPFVYSGSGLWTGNFYGTATYVGYLNEFVKKIKADAVSTGFTNIDYVNRVDKTTEYTENDIMGWVDTLKEWVVYSPSPILVVMSAFENWYGTGWKSPLPYPRLLKWFNDYLAQYGSSSKIAGFNLYDYVGGLSGSPPLNQLPCSIKTIYDKALCEANGGTWKLVVDSPYPQEFWDAWDVWTPKNLTTHTLAYQSTPIAVALTLDGQQLLSGQSTQIEDGKTVTIKVPSEVIV